MLEHLSRRARGWRKPGRRTWLTAATRIGLAALLVALTAPEATPTASPVTPATPGTLTTPPPGAGGSSTVRAAMNRMPGSTYHVMDVARVVGTASGANALASEEPEWFQVAGAWGIPVGATAVTGVVAIADPSRAGYLALTAVAASPAAVATSTLDFPAQATRSEYVTADLGDDGRLWALYEAGATGETARLMFDVDGYYAPDARGATYRAVGPVRAFDSAAALGGAAPLASGRPSPFSSGACSESPPGPPPSPGH